MNTSAQLEDKINVREIIERYFFAVDAKDRNALINCFSADAEASYHWMTPEQKTIVGGAAVAEDVYAACSRFTSSTHSIANLIVDVTGEGAEANTFAIAHVIRDTSLVVRGLRYQDKLVRTTQGWRIAWRKHTPMWQTEATVQSPRLF
jgi:ketosteroid isomerase-like protein